MTLDLSNDKPIEWDRGRFDRRCARLGTKAILAATLVLAACGASVGIAIAEPHNPGPPPGPVPGPAANTDNPGPAPGPAPKTAIDHDGTYAVGTEIAPGTYSSAGPVGKGACYWKRLSGPNGKDIVDNAMTKKPQVVQIEPSDKAFKTDGCQPWQKTDADGAPPGDAQPQLRNDIDTLNGLARQFGAAQLPPP